MSRHYMKKADTNQPELVKFLRQMGASFQHTHQIAGALDGIVGHCGIDCRVEIKDPNASKQRRELTPAEKRTIEGWCGRKPVILFTKDDCIDLLFSMREEARRRRDCKCAPIELEPVAERN